MNSQIKVRNAANTIDQVVIGKQASGSYGISVNKSDGTQVFRVNETEAVLRNVTVDTLTASSSISASVIKGSTLQLLQTNPTDNVSVQASKTSYADTTSGLWMGVDSGTPKLNIGNATSYLKYNGSDLEIAAKVYMSADSTISWSNISTAVTSNVTASALGAVKTDLTNAPSSILNSNVTASSIGAMVINPATTTNIGSNYVYTGTIGTNKLVANGALIGSALIGNAAVDTLQIAGSAIQMAQVGQGAGSTYATISMNVSNINNIWPKVLLQGFTLADTAGTLRVEVKRPSSGVFTADDTFYITLAGTPTIPVQYFVARALVLDEEGTWQFRLYNTITTNQAAAVLLLWGGKR